MKVCRDLGAALLIACSAIACSDVPTTPTSASPSTSGTAAAETAASPFDVKYTVKASAGANGTISPTGTVSVSAGSIQSFTITPAANYRIADVMVDGNSVGPEPTVTFNDVKANHTVTATFAPDLLVGLYTGPLTMTASLNILDSDCVGPSIGTAGVGVPEESALSITLNQTSVAVTLRSASSGLQCSYAGQTTGGFFSVNAAHCDAPLIALQCIDGRSRGLMVIGSTIHGQLSGNTITGTVATYYNVGATAVPFTGLITQHSFTTTRR